MTNGNSQNYSIRGQINYDGVIDEIHQITALAGMEIRETRDWANGARYYGYNEKTLIAGSQLPNPYINIWGYNSYLTDASPETDYQRRYLSYYGNLSYTLMNKYVLSEVCVMMITIILVLIGNTGQLRCGPPDFHGILAGKILSWIM